MTPACSGWGEALAQARNLENKALLKKIGLNNVYSIISTYCDVSNYPQLTMPKKIVRISIHAGTEIRD
jgi:hypothetical protein